METRLDVTSLAVLAYCVAGVKSAANAWRRKSWLAQLFQKMQPPNPMRAMSPRSGGLLLAVLIIVPVTRSGKAERINQEGRILGPAPVVTTPTLFNTLQADAIVSAMQIFPVTSAWNEDISRRPLLANSAAMINQIKADLSSSRQTLRPFYEMNYVLVPDNQPQVTIPFLDYPDESDLDGGTFPNGRYPIPSNQPIETWPKDQPGVTLQQWQMDANNSGGDRHGIMVAPGVGSIWETWQMKLASTGWQASCGAKFDLNSNALRPAGWTSGDAAGLPMFPALVRYDECQRGMVEHAVRLVVVKSRKQYVYPANHYASSIPATSVNYPAMGQRLRLKSSFVIPDNWTIEEKAVLRGLKKYGGIVADNGNFFSMSVCPDDRFASTAFSHLSSIDVNNFEVVQTTGPNEGPRSPNPPSVNAGADQNIGTLNTTLSGAVVDPSGTATVQWKLYSGPAPVTIINPGALNTSLTFGQFGSYTFLLSANDSVHAVAYDAVIVNVQTSATPTPSPTATPVATPTPTPIQPPTPTASPTPVSTPPPGPAVTPLVRVGVAPGRIIEGNDAVFIVSLSAPVSQTLTIHYSLGGTARLGIDYALSDVPGQVTISAGETSAAVVLHAIADHVKERQETVSIILAPGSGYKVPKRSKAVVTIVNAP